jgi:cation diffusion facilitator CzcD-associated flavoprotein CzcO
MSDALIALEAQVRDDLARTSHPNAPWLTPTPGPYGKPALDVLVVGAGQSGIAAAFGLMRSQVTNVLILDKAEEGQEGPWLAYARMYTLRSPKHFTGPDLDIPSLTYQSWHEACFGKEHWQTLGLIPRQLWAEYLLWLRRVVGLTVRNGCELLEIAPAMEGLLAAIVESAGGTEMLYARKIVLATGQEAMGNWTIPEPLRDLPATRVVNASEPVDFEALRGAKVAVIGAGATAFDNAATALEAGAAEVHLLCRRAEIQLIQPYIWLTFRGFLRHLDMREGFPQATYDRCARFANFHLHEGSPIEAAKEVGNKVELTTPRGVLSADFVICGTGTHVDFAERRELRNCAGNIASWADRYQPPESERSVRLGRYPYLADDYAFTELISGQTPWISNVHLFAFASTMSFGPSGSSINAMTTAIPKLVYGLTRGLFCADLERHWNSFKAYDVPQAIVARQAQVLEK